MTQVIVISGMEGSGKSSLAKALMDRFKDSSNRFVSIDDYSGSNHWYPDWLGFAGDRLYAVRKWKDAGADPNKAVDTPELKDDLFLVKKLDELDLVFLEEPFGRLREEIVDLIDIAVHIEISLDIALARGTIRNSANGVDPLEYLERYLNSDLKTLYTVQNMAAEKADFVVNGTQSLVDVANETADFIRSKISKFS